MAFHKDKISEGEFQTSEIDLVTALSLQFPVVKTEVSPIYRSRIIFYFEATNDLMNYVEAYRSKQILVEPRAYYNQLREIRSQINNLLEIEKNQPIN